MKAKRMIPAIAMTLVLSLAACSDALGPTGQGPDIASVLEDEDNQDSQSQLGQTKERRPLEQQ